MNAGTAITRDSLRGVFAPWQARWDRQARRIDALSLRERAILFLCIAAVLAALFDTLVLTPLSARAKQRAEALATQATEVGQLRDQFVAASRAGSADPSAPLVAQLQAAQAERSRLDTELARSVGSRGGDLPGVLQRLLARQPELGLTRLALVDDAAAAPGGTAASSPAATGLAGLRWQGVELEVEGGYGPALRYLQSLERELPGLRWGELRVRSKGDPQATQLQARLYVLRAQP